jgi:hypothetical protein
MQEGHEGVRMKIAKYALLATLLLIIPLFMLSGCGPKPPVPYQQLQVQDTEEASGWDVYLYIAVNPNSVNSEEVRRLLEWFRDVRFANANRIMIYVWDNPQSALMNAMGNLVGTLKVDRGENIDEIVIN